MSGSAGVGKVYLVGAGPGDPTLITVRAVECLRRADVILYDYLVNPQILEHAPPAAELVCLGRHGQGRIMPQEDINRRLVDEARRGHTVVRLKAGDPTIFAHGAEEMGCVRRVGIPLEVIPGITAAAAASGYAGIPITDRQLASAVAYITGQEAHDKQGPPLNIGALAGFPGTLIVYMGVTTARTWTKQLLAAGKPADTPAAIVRRCSWPDQQVFRCRLDQISALIDREHLQPPAIVILGPVAHRDKAIDWVSARPLVGQTVLVARPLPQALVMRHALAELGAQVVIQPAIEILDPPDWGPVDRAILQMDGYDWLVFSSVNGVRYFLDRIDSVGRDTRILGGVKLASIGPETARSLRLARLRVDLQPDQYRAEELAEALAAEARGKRFLLVRASRGRDLLARRLAEAGGQVESIVVYTSRDVTSADAGVVHALEQGAIDWTAVTSSAIAGSLVRLFGAALKKTRLVTISPVTSTTLRQLGHEPAAEATQYTIPGVVRALVDAVATGRSRTGRS